MRSSCLGSARIFLQFGYRIVHQLTRYNEAFHFRRRQLELDVAEDPFAHSHQAARASLLVTRALGNLLQAFVGEQYLNVVGREILFILSNDAAFRIFENEKQIVHIQ